MRSPQNGQEYNWKAIPLEGGTLPPRPLGQEYDGLESGELAWILGRRFGGSGTDPEKPSNPSFASIGQSAHGLGVGFGPDRMQRLAYTAWVEAFFRGTFGKMAFPLHLMPIVSNENTYLSSQLNEYKPFLSGCTVLGSVDLPHVINGALSNVAAKQLQYTDAFDKNKKYNPTKFENGVNIGTVDPGSDANPSLVAADPGRFQGALSGLSSGIFVMEEGPFLRGKIVDDSAVDMVAPGLAATNSGAKIFHSVSRNLGDEMAFEALYSQMRAKSFFDWSPDGMVLSKLESPSGEPLSSAELDARQAQLFNVAIQGPAIAKTWTGDPKQAAMPMDRVFVVMVADLCTTLDTDKTAGQGGGSQEVVKAYVAWNNGANARDARNPTKYSTVDDAMKASNDNMETDYSAYTPDTTGYHADVLKLFETTAAAAAAAPGGTGTEVQKARQRLDAYFANFDRETFQTEADKVRRGVAGVKSSVLCNFRLMRVTSSFLAQYSALKVKGTGGSLDPSSRCGLRLGQKTTGESIQYTGEYIIGGWCIGTVTDSAASRSTIGHQVRITPASMAINISVNVEWWSGDKLYKHYMDVDGSVQRRGELSSREDAPAHNVGLSVGKADLPEALSFVPANA